VPNSARFDRVFKSLAEADPRGLLHLIGALPLDQPAEIEPVDREVGIPALRVDHLFKVRSQNREWMVHFEVQARYRGDEPDRMGWYGTSVVLKHRIPLQSVLILMSKKHSPRRTPGRKRLVFDSIEIRARFTVVCLWKIKARLALEADRPNLLPWVALLDATHEELEEAVGKIERLGDEKLAVQCSILGSLRYDESSIPKVLERIGLMLPLSDEILMESWLVRPLVEKAERKAEKKGEIKGELDGRLGEARRSLQHVVSLRFPAIGALRGLKTLSDFAILERLRGELILARNEAAARRILADNKLLPPAR